MKKSSLVSSLLILPLLFGTIFFQHELIRTTEASPNLLDDSINVHTVTLHPVLDGLITYENGAFSGVSERGSTAFVGSDYKQNTTYHFWYRAFFRFDLGSVLSKGEITSIVLKLRLGAKLTGGAPEGDVLLEYIDDIGATIDPTDWNKAIRISFGTIATLTTPINTWIGSDVKTAVIDVLNKGEQFISFRLNGTDLDADPNYCRYEIQTSKHISLFNPRLEIAYNGAETSAISKINVLDSAIIKLEKSSLGVRALYVTENETIYGITEKGLYKSLDGISWAQITEDLYPSGYLHLNIDMGRGLYVDSRHNIFISAKNSSNGYLFRSVDGGKSFTMVQQLGANNNFWRMTEDVNGYLYFGEYGPTGPAKIWKSNDNGAIWSTVYMNNNEKHVHWIGYDDGIIFAILGDANYPIVFSSDQGSSWTILTNNNHIIPSVTGYDKGNSGSFLFTTGVFTDNYRIFGSDIEPLFVVRQKKQDWSWSYSYTSGYRFPLPYSDVAWDMALNGKIVYLASIHEHEDYLPSFYASPDEGQTWVRLMNMQEIGISYTGFQQIGQRTVDGYTIVASDLPNGSLITFRFKLSLKELLHITNKFVLLEGENVEKNLFPTYDKGQYWISFQSDPITEPKIKFTGVSVTKVFNESFENGIGSWTASMGSSTYETTEIIAYDGKYSLKVSTNDANFQGYLSKTVFVNIPSGKRVMFGFSSVLSGNYADNTKINLNVTFETAKKQLWTKLNSTSWFRLYRDYVPNSNITSINIRVEFYGKGTMYIDAISIATIPDAYRHDPFPYVNHDDTVNPQVYINGTLISHSGTLSNMESSQLYPIPLTELHGVYNLTVITKGSGMVGIRISGVRKFFASNLLMKRWQENLYGSIKTCTNPSIAIYDSNIMTVYLTTLTSSITFVNFANQKLSFTVNTPSGATSTTKIYCADKAIPIKVTINGIEQRQGADWVYDSGTKLLTITWTHNEANIEVSWYTDGVSVLTYLYVIIFLVVVGLYLLTKVKIGKRKYR